MLYTNTNGAFHDFRGQRMLARYAPPTGNNRIFVVEAAS
jgi:hypothetical protein